MGPRSRHARARHCRCSASLPRHHEAQVQKVQERSPTPPYSLFSRSSSAKRRTGTLFRHQTMTRTTPSMANSLASRLKVGPSFASPTDSSPTPLFPATLSLSATAMTTDPLSPTARTLSSLSRAQTRSLARRPRRKTWRRVPRRLPD